MPPPEPQAAPWHGCIGDVFNVFNTNTVLVRNRAIESAVFNEISTQTAPQTPSVGGTLPRCLRRRRSLPAAEVGSRRKSTRWVLVLSARH